MHSACPLSFWIIKPVETFFEPDAQDATDGAPYAFLFLWEARD